MTEGAERNVPAHDVRPDLPLRHRLRRRPPPGGGGLIGATVQGRHDGVD